MEDIDGVLVLKEGLQALGDYAASAQALALRLEAAMTATDACRRLLAGQLGEIEVEQVMIML